MEEYLCFVQMFRGANSLAKYSLLGGIGISLDNIYSNRTAFILDVGCGAGIGLENEMLT